MGKKHKNECDIDAFIFIELTLIKLLENHELLLIKDYMNFIQDGENMGHSWLTICLFNKINMSG